MIIKNFSYKLFFVFVALGLGVSLFSVFLLSYFQVQEYFVLFLSIFVPSIFISAALSYFLAKNFKDTKNYLESEIEILDKKQIKEIIEKSETIIKFASSGIGTLDLQGNFLSVNDAYVRLLGYSREEFLQMSCFDLSIDEKGKELSRKALQIAYSIGNIYKLEKLCSHKDGHIVAVDISLDLLPDKKTFVVVINSLEDQKRLEDLNKNLEIRINKEIEKSTKQLEAIQQEQLRTAKLKSIGSLAAGITHEINTPLTFIKGNFEMMLEEIKGLDETQSKQYLLDDAIKVQDGIGRIQSIVDAMREVSSNSAESRSDLNIYETIITALTVAYNRSRHISKIYLNGELFDTKMDKHKYNIRFFGQKQRLEQVWIVIINNALDELVKKDDFDKRVLAIETSCKDDLIKIYFKDNAGGIDEAILPIIFEPFVSNKEHCGVGVGLNIASNIINEHYGIIEAYNQKDGAVFEITLSNKNRKMEEE